MRLSKDWLTHPLEIFSCCECNLNDILTFLPHWTKRHLRFLLKFNLRICLLHTQKRKVMNKIQQDPAERSKSDSHGRLTLLKFVICHWHDSSKAAPCNTWVLIIRSCNKVYFKIGKMIQCFYTRNRMPFFGKTKVSKVVWILSSFHKLTFPIGYEWKRF